MQIGGVVRSGSGRSCGGEYRVRAGAMLAFAFATGMTLVSPEAKASGYLTARFGADHGSPVSNNPYAVYFNPAAMGGTQGTQITLEAAPILRFVSYERTNNALGDPALADPSNTSEEAVRYRAANTGTANLTNLLALGYLGATTDFGAKVPLRLGYALYVPFGGIAKWDRRDDPIANDPLAPGARDGVQRWHNISGQLLSLYNTLALSYTIEPIRLSFGANASFIHHSIDTVRARNIPANDDAITQGGEVSEGRTRFDASGTNFSVGFGVYWEPTADRRLRLGASYTSQPAFGEMRLKGELTAQQGNVATRDTPEAVDFLQSYPDVVRLGGSWFTSDTLELRADFEYVRWSVLDKQCVVAPGRECVIDATTGEGSGVDIVLNIPRKWQDSVGGRAGVGWFFAEQTELFGSAAFTTSAIPRGGMDASAIDSFRLYGTLGLRQNFGPHFALAGSFNVIHFLTVDTKGESNTDKLSNPSKSPSADGIYKSNVLLLNINGTARF